MANTKQTAKNLIFNSTSFAINLAISLCFTPYLIRTVGKEAYSFFPLVNGMIGYTSIITTAVGSMAGRFITMRIYQDDIKGANVYLNSEWVANLVLSVLFSIAGFFCIVYIDKILTVPPYLLEDVRWLFGLGLVGMVIGMLSGYLGLGTYIKNRIDLSCSRDMICNIIKISCIFLLFFLFKPSIVYMSLSAFIASLVGLWMNYGFKSKLIPELTLAPKKYYSFKAIKTLVSSGIWNSVNQLSNILLYQLDLLITNIFIGAAVTGDYAIAKTAPSMILGFLAMFAGTFVPQFNILYAQKKIEELVKEVRKAMIVVSIFIGIPIGFMVVFSDAFYSLWVPGQDSNMLFWMTLITLLPMIFGGSVNPVFGIYSVTNHLKIPSFVLLGAGLLNVGITLILLYTTNLGVWAIIIVSAIQGGLRNVLFSPAYGAICIGKKWTAFYPTMLRGIMGMTIVVIISLVFKFTIHVDSWLSFLLVGLSVAILSLMINPIVLMTKNERLFMLDKIKSTLRSKFHL